MKWRFIADEKFVNSVQKSYFKQALGPQITC